MLDGAKKLSESTGFIITNEQINMLSEYRQENSSVEGFIAECLEVEEGAEVNSRDIYDEYKSYCIKDGRKFKGSILFTKEMRTYGHRYGTFSFIERTSGHGASVFKGIKIFNEWTKDRNIHREVRDF